MSYNKIICKYRQSTALETYVLSTEGRLKIYQLFLAHTGVILVQYMHLLY